MNEKINSLYLVQQREEIRGQIRREILQKGWSFLNGSSLDVDETRELNQLFGKALIQEVFDFESTEYRSLKFLLNSKVNERLERKIIRDAREKLQEIDDAVEESIEKERKNADAEAL